VAVTFSNLQNKIDLKKIKEDHIEIDSEFAFREDFDIVNKTLSYFQEKKHKTNNIVIKEEVIEYENKDIFDSIKKLVREEQNYIYNDEEYSRLYKLAINNKELATEDDLASLNESYAKYHKERGILPQLLEDANEELRTELDAYRMVNNDYEKFTSDDFDVKALFDSQVIDLARKEQLNQIYTVNWLEKQLIEYAKSMTDSLGKSKEFQIDNGLKSLDISDTDEIKNKIKDLQESTKFLKSKIKRMA